MQNCDKVATRINFFDKMKEKVDENGSFEDQFKKMLVILHKFYKNKMAQHNCEQCSIRTKYDKAPKSLIGRFWRWHIKIILYNSVL